MKDHSYGQSAVDQDQGFSFPDRRWLNVVLIVARRLRRRPIINPALRQPKAFRIQTFQNALRRCVSQP